MGARAQGTQQAILVARTEHRLKILIYGTNKTAGREEREVMQRRVGSKQATFAKVTISFLL